MCDTWALSFSLSLASGSVDRDQRPWVTVRLFAWKERIMERQLIRNSCTAPISKRHVEIRAVCMMWLNLGHLVMFLSLKLGFCLHRSWTAQKWYKLLLPLLSNCIKKNYSLSSVNQPSTMYICIDGLKEIIQLKRLHFRAVWSSYCVAFTRDCCWWRTVCLWRRSIEPDVCSLSFREDWERVLTSSNHKIWQLQFDLRHSDRA